MKTIVFSGRSISEYDMGKPRDKREVVQKIPAKDGAYMRYAKNANFVRFGRSQPISSIPGLIKELSQFPKDVESKYRSLKIKHLLEELRRRQQEAFSF